MTKNQCLFDDIGIYSNNMKNNVRNAFFHDFTIFFFILVFAYFFFISVKNSKFIDNYLRLNTVSRAICGNLIDDKIIRLSHDYCYCEYMDRKEQGMIFLSINKKVNLSFFL